MPRYELKYGDEVIQLVGTKDEVENYICHVVPFTVDYFVKEITRVFNIENPTHFIEFWAGDIINGYTSMCPINYLQECLDYTKSLSLRTIAIFKIKKK